MKRQERRNLATLPPLTPNLLLQERIKIVPDTKIEKALYSMLLDAMQQIEVLKFRIKQLRDGKAEALRQRAIRKKIKHTLSGPLAATALGREARKGKGL